MDCLVTNSTERNQILLRIMPQPTSRSDVVDFQAQRVNRTFGNAIRPAPRLIDAARIRFAIETNSRALRSVHDVVATLSRNSCCSEEESSPNRRSNASRNGFVSPLSRLAPAKKSAQIISRQ